MRESREYARNPLAASGRSVLAALLTIWLPIFCSSTFGPEKCSTRWTCRSAMTMSARPATIGCTRSAMRSCGYWLSPSVLTTMSAPSSSARWTPSWKDRPRPRLRAWRTKCTTPCSLATSTVRSVDPSSMIRTMISSIPSMDVGIVDRTAGRVSSSLRQGTWTTRRTSLGLRRPDDGPRVRRGDLADRRALRHEALEAGAGPVVEVAGGVAQVLDVATGQQVGAAEERLVRDRQQHVPRRHAGELSQAGVG